MVINFCREWLSTKSIKAREIQSERIQTVVSRKKIHPLIFWKLLTVLAIAIISIGCINLDKETFDFPQADVYVSNIAMLCTLTANEAGVGYQEVSKYRFDWFPIESGNSIVLSSPGDKIQIAELRDNKWYIEPLITDMLSQNLTWSNNTNLLAAVSSSSKIGRLNTYDLNIYDIESTLVSSFAGPAIFPVWSNDGQTIAFSAPKHLGGDNQVHIANIETGYQYVPDLNQTDPFSYFPHSWSENNEYLALRFRTLRFEKLGVYVVDTGEFTPIFPDDPTCEDSISWSPNSNSLLFQQLRDGRTDIVTFDLKSQQSTNLTQTNEVDELQPTYSPDGNYIAYISASKPDRFGEPYQDIFILNTQTLKKTQITNTATSFESAPKWSPDGTMLAFAVRESGSLQLYLDVFDLKHSEQVRIGLLSGY